MPYTYHSSSVHLVEFTCRTARECECDVARLALRTVVVLRRHLLALLGDAVGTAGTGCSVTLGTASPASRLRLRPGRVPEDMLECVDRECVSAEI